MEEKLESMKPSDLPDSDFRRQVEQKPPGLVREVWEWCLHNKKWWLMPAVVALLLVGLLIVLAGTGAAPFIYTLF